MNYKLKTEIEKIVSSNCREVPYEGTEVDKTSIIEAFSELLENESPKINTSIYKEDFRSDAWADYCEAFGVPVETEQIQFSAKLKQG